MTAAGGAEQPDGDGKAQRQAEPIVAKQRGRRRMGDQGQRHIRIYRVGVTHIVGPAVDVIGPDDVRMHAVEQRVHGGLGPTPDVDPRMRYRDGREQLQHHG
jgi:hypothetical protein